MWADAIVVLGCTLRPEDGAPSPALARRVTLGARAYRERVAGRVIASGGRRWGGHIEALVMRRMLQAEGVPESAVEVELCSLCTADNAAYCAELLQEQRASRVLLVTSRWHLPRAMRAFARCGVVAAAPPVRWYAEDPSPGLSTRVRERVSGWVDAAMFARAESS